MEFIAEYGSRYVLLKLTTESSNSVKSPINVTVLGAVTSVTCTCLSTNSNTFKVRRAPAASI